MNIKLKMNLRMQPVSQALNPQLKKKKNPKQMTKPQKNVVGDHDCSCCKNPEKEDWDGKHQAQLQKATPTPKLQKPQAR